MGFFTNIYPARILRIRTKGELIAAIACLVIYFVLNVILQKVCPNTEQKKINIISLIPAVIVAFILIFTLD